MPRLNPRLPSLPLVLGCLSSVTGCGGSSTTTLPPDNVVAAVHITGISQPVLVGANAQLAATATNAAGDVLSRTFTWSSSSSAVASVGADGTVAALSAGSAAITASVDGKTGSLTVTVNNAVPVATTISPASVAAGASAQTLTVVGSGFVTTSVVRWNGTDLVTSFTSSTRLTAQVPGGDVVVAGASQVTVFTPGPGGGTSSAQVFTVSAVGSNPVPAITSLSPASTTSGGASFVLTVTGTNFLNTSTVNWNGAARPTTFASGTRLTAQIGAGDIAATGNAAVTVVNPSPGGGTSTPQSFTISAVGTNPAPTITALGPTSAAAGGAAFALTVTGTNFLSSSTVKWNGAPRTTTFVSATRLTAQISAADIASSATNAVTVVNPTPGGGIAAAQSFAVFTSLLPLTYAQLPPALVAQVQGQITADAQSAATSITAPGLLAGNGSGRFAIRPPPAGNPMTAPVRGAPIAMLGRIPAARMIASGNCPLISPANPPVDALGLPLGAVTYTWTLANCTEDALTSQSGMATLTGPAAGNSGYNYTITLVNFDYRVGDSTGTIEALFNAVDSVRNNTPGVIDEWLTEPQELTETGAHFGHLVDTVSLHTVFTYTVGSGTLLYNVQMPAGTIVLNQTTKYAVDPGNNFGVSGTITVVTSTPTPLQFDPTCTAAVQYVGGVLQSVVAGRTTTTTYGACNTPPIIQ